MGKNKTRKCPKQNRPEDLYDTEGVMMLVNYIGHSAIHMVVVSGFLYMYYTAGLNIINIILSESALGKQGIKDFICYCILLLGIKLSSFFANSFVKSNDDRIQQTEIINSCVALLILSCLLICLQGGNNAFLPLCALIGFVVPLEWLCTDTVKKKKFIDRIAKPLRYCFSQSGDNGDKCIALSVTFLDAIIGIMIICFTIVDCPYAKQIAFALIAIEGVVFYVMIKNADRIHRWYAGGLKKNIRRLNRLRKLAQNGRNHNVENKEA